MTNTANNSTCPRCGTAFYCNAGDIQNCQCNGVKLSDEQRQYVMRQFSGCLCANCMRQLAQEYQKSIQPGN